ncbi:YDG domain-containing protein [Plebeiibacterium sediminum]|uniref:YDG domain-containing protein n=1 Tax=Plebeiibacterium sediminum TaxID=2992112 RepID=A0AAE3M2I8_9BACT|nr:YDG domain-containing protein [Plebeiobacterium sediminum]MCW3786086.1 YDG domain-containing protein [Plebeiobacterium sediminum]
MKIVNLFKSILFFLLLLSYGNAYSKTIYVATDGDGTDGSSWATAYTHIQAAIDAAVSGDAIWVKEGVYYADPLAPGLVEDVNRALSITLKSGVKLYGGFTADEVTIDDRPMLDLNGNGIIDSWEYSSPTVISGEIQNDGDKTNNTQHILIVPDGADVNTLVDGFTFEDGYSDVQSTVTGIGTFTYASGVIISGGKLIGCMIQNCESNSVFDSYGGGLVAHNADVEGCYVDGCTITGRSIYGGGVYLNTSNMECSLVKNCGLDALVSSGGTFGGGVYSTTSVIDSCYVIGNSANPESNFKGYGGGMYNSNSHVIDCTIADNNAEGVEGFGGGVYGISSTYINTLLYNNETSSTGGGAYGFTSYFTNCVVSNNKTTGTNAIGGGAYGDTESTFYNTVFWGNTSSGTSPNLRLSTGGEAFNCAFDSNVTGTNAVLISPSNQGAEAGVLYPHFMSPTTFVGNTNGDAANESELAVADWNITFSSDLMERGDNNGFYEAFVGVDLDGDGAKTKNLDKFTDFINEYRLFNYKIDIGAFEPAFVELTLPAPITMEYGLTLGEILLEDGSALDLRSNSDIPGVYSFTDASTVPQYENGDAKKYRVVFTPEDIVTFAPIYDSIDVTITAKELTMSGLSADDKVYDGNTDVTFSGTATLEGIVGTDDVTLNATGIYAAFEDENAGVDKNVNFSGYTLSGVDAGNYTLSLSGALATITPKPVSVSPLTANDRDYDGTVDATYSGTPEVLGAIVGDDVSVDASSGVGLFDSKVVGVDKPVAFAGFKLTGADAGNYALSQPADSKATISPLAVVVEGVSAADKVYDGTSIATIQGTAVVNGVIQNDNVTLNETSVSASFDSKMVGVDKTVTFSGYFIMGADAVNYSLSQPDTDLADITAKELSVSGLSAEDKQYDGSASATLSGSATLNGAVGSDDVNLNTGSILATFSDANVGTAKEINISGVSLSGLDQSNYTLTIPALTADITPVEIIIVADNISIDYGDADPELTYVVTSGSLVGSDNFTGNLEREAGDNAGTYNITQGSLAISTNYNISFTPAVFTINKAANVIDFSLTPTSYYLNETDQITLDATSTSGLTIAYSSSDPNILSVSGNVLTVHSFGAVTITASDAGGTNYIAASDVSVDLTIAVAVIQKGTSMLLVNNTKEVFTSYQWYKNGSAISGATKQYYYDANGLSGEYYCKLDGRFDSDSWTGGVNAVTMDVYPSPALKGATFTVEFDRVDESSLNNSTMSIYSVTGALIKKMSNVNSVNQLQLTEPGIYIIKTEGEVQTVKKIIVK